MGPFHATGYVITPAGGGDRPAHQTLKRKKSTGWLSHIWCIRKTQRLKLVNLSLRNSVTNQIQTLISTDQSGSIFLHHSYISVAASHQGAVKYLIT